MSITKGERDELRRVVRGDFKALTEEIDVRRVEMQAEIEKRVAARFMAHEDVINKTKAAVATIVDEANGQIVSALQDCQASCDGYTVQYAPLTAPHVYFAREKRDEMRRAMLADVDARVAQAKARMHRQENDLLKSLAMGAIESEEAHTFLASIPTVAELVPASRLKELEAQFEDDYRPEDD